MSKGSTSGNGTVIVLLVGIIGLGVAIKFLQDHWPIIAAVGGVLILALIILAMKRKKARKVYSSLPIVYVGNSSTKTYHLHTCRQALEIAPANKVGFRSREEAVRNGYKPCGACRP